MNKKNKALNVLLLSTVLITGCLPPTNTLNNSPSPAVTGSINPSSSVTPEPDTTISPTATPSIGGGGGNVVTSPTPISNTTPIPGVTSTPTPTNTNLPKVSFTSLSSLEGVPGNVITIRGSNFINGKVKNIVFVNTVNSEITATIVRVSDTELVFSIPDNTRTGIASGSAELSQAYQFLKVYFVLDTSEKILINDFFKILFTNSSNSSGGGGVGGGSSLGGGDTPTPSPTSTNGNVTVIVDPNQPTQTTGNVNVTVDFNSPTAVEFGTIAGTLKNSLDNTILSGATITVFNSSGVQVGQGVSRADGTYSIQARVGTGYYLTISLNGYTTFNYYLENLNVTLNTITSIENVYLTTSVTGSKVISGRLVDVNGLIIANAIVRFYTADGRILMTGRTDASGNYSFTVPFFNDGYFLIRYAGYRDFYYYVDINASTVVSFATFALTLLSDATMTVSGQIFDAVSRLGISLSVVDVLDASGRLIFSGRTNTSGFYSFIYRSGVYSYIVRRRGYGIVYVNSLESLSNIYLINEANFGKGGVLGYIVDSQNQSDVSGLTLRLRSGINNKTGDLVSFRDRNGLTTTSTVSGPRGAYSMDNIDAGNYTVEIVGKTIILNGNAITYNTSYFNILIIGNDTTQYTGTASR